MKKKIWESFFHHLDSCYVLNNNRKNGFLERGVNRKVRCDEKKNRVKCGGVEYKKEGKGGGR